MELRNLGTAACVVYTLLSAMTTWAASPVQALKDLSIEYTALDLRLGWQLRSNVDLSLAGQNLLGGGHGEFTDVATRTDVKRAVFLKLQCRL